MNLLYLSEDFVTTKVHHNLITNLLDSSSVSNISVFCVIRNDGTIRIDDQYMDHNYELVLYNYEGNLVRYKYDFFYKIRCKFKQIEYSFNLTDFDLVHASTLFSEGAVAYKIFKRYAIPYTVCVRGTDLSLYLRYAPHLWILAKKILKNAKFVFFISPHLKQKLYNHYFLRRHVLCIESKSVIIPNGVDNIWMNNLRSKSKTSSNHNLLYIGRFDTNKNVVRLQKAVIKASKNCTDIHLILIGGNGNQSNLVLKYCAKYPDLFDYKGRIYEKTKLIEIMRNCDIFIMVSHSETFGLVYLEALSQGLPVIFTEGQGIDGIFVENVGESVKSKSVNSISNGILNIFSNYAGYVSPKNAIEQFSWKRISQAYVHYFFLAINKN